MGTESPNIPIDVAKISMNEVTVDKIETKKLEVAEGKTDVAEGKTAMDAANNPRGVLKLFFQDIESGKIRSAVITKELAGAVVEEFDETKCTKYSLNTLLGVEEMILMERKAEILPNKDGLSIVSKIKVHSRRAIKLWTPATGDEMRKLFSFRDKGSDDAPSVDLCPKSNLGVWIKLKMRQEFKTFEDTKRELV
jgi:hypothetical protein